MSQNEDQLSSDEETKSQTEEIKGPAGEWKHLVSSNQVKSDLDYLPSLDFRSNYTQLQELCNEQLSPAKILKMSRNSDGRIFIFKVVDKNKLFGDF